MLKDNDPKKRIELAVTGIGVVIFIFLIVNHIPGSKGNKPASKAEAFSASEPLSAFFTNDERRTTNDEKWGRDPFLLDTSNTKEHGMEDLALNGIMPDKQNPYAIINNEVVKLGDKIGGMTVIEINENNVVLDESGQRHILELNLY